MCVCTYSGQLLRGNLERFRTKGGKTECIKSWEWCGWCKWTNGALVLLGDGPPDIGHDEVGLDGAARVDGSALLLSGHSADVGGNVVQNCRLRHVDGIVMAEGCSDSKLVFLCSGIKDKLESYVKDKTT